MSFIIGKILTLLSGPALSKVFEYLESKEKTAKVKLELQKQLVEQAVITNAQVEQARIKTIEKKYEYPIFRITIFLLSVPLILYLNAIIFVSVFPNFGFTIQRAPEFVHEMLWIVLIAYFGSPIVNNLVERFMKK